MKLIINSVDIYPPEDRNADANTIYEIPDLVSPKFDIGDMVKIKDSGFTYSAYRAAAVACGLITPEESLKMKNYYMTANTGQTGEIVGGCRHEQEKRNIYGILLSDGKRVLVEERGLSLLKKASYIREDLFDI